MKYLWILTIVTFASAGLLPFENETWESGYLSTGTPGDFNYYFLFVNRQGNSTAPLIIWLNGGPGCSSLGGLFQENGPVFVNRTSLKFQWNPYSWNTFADVIFVDQPVGTGLSVSRDNSTLCREEVCVARNFYAFFLNFLEKYPQYISQDLYITGESYAGKYIPAIASYFARAQNPAINLKGVAIGNPLTHMSIQVQAYPLFLLENNLLNFFGYILARTITAICYVAEQTALVPRKHLESLCDQTFGGLGDIPNPYDIRENKTYDDIDKVVTDLINDKEVQQYLGVNVSNFEMCTGYVGEAMFDDIVLSETKNIEYLLERGYDVMLYFGNKDYICNWKGGELLANSINWNGKEGYKKAEVKEWNSEGKPAGTYKKYKNFNFATVYDAGHMVPLDQPQFALTMILKFVFGGFNY